MGKLVLNYISSDSWDRPVYENDGKLFVDVDPLSYRKPEICTKLGNDFDGEPNIPIQCIKMYENVEVEFLPERITWR